MIEFLKDKKLRVYFIIYFIFSIIIVNLRLFNYLGFEYSAVVGLFSFIVCSVFIYQNYYKRNQKVDFLQMVFHSIKNNLLFLIVPFIVAILNILFVKNCSFFQGILFFVLIPVITVLFSVSLSIFVYSLFNSYKRLALYVIFLIIIIFNLSEYYFYPQLFIYNPFIGFFPGLMYDEELNITSSLVIYRLYNIAVAFLLISFSNIFYQTQAGTRIKDKILKLKFVLKNPVIILLLIFIILFHLYSNELGITSSKSYIVKKLGNEYHTKNFTIYYSSKSIDEKSIKEIANLHEFYFYQICKELSIDYKHRIESFIYSTPEEKISLIGAKYTIIAKPWLQQIHLNQNSVSEVLKHELVHILAGDFGLPILKIGRNASLIEGLAMAIEWQWGYRTLHEYSASIMRFLPQVDVKGVFSNYGFISTNPNISYVLSGSFIKYLIENYGIESVKKIYPNANYNEVINKNLNNLLLEWKKYLLDHFSFEEDSVITIFTFKRPSMFQKVCFRTIANLNEKANYELQKRNFDKAVEIFKESIALSNNYNAKIGLVNALFKKGDYERVIKASNFFLSDESQNIFLTPIRLYLADAYMIKAYNENNQSYFDSAYKECSYIFKYHISENLDFQSRIRMSIINNPKWRDVMIKYFTENNDESLKMLYLSEIINTYNFNLGELLLGRILYNKEKYSKSIEYLQKIDDSNMSNFFLYEKYLLLGKCFLKNGDYYNSIENFKKSIIYSSNESSTNRLNELIELCNFLIKK